MKYLVLLVQFVIFLCALCIIYLVPFIYEWLVETEFLSPITWGLCVGAVIGIISGTVRHIVLSGILLLCPLVGMLFNALFDNAPSTYVFALAILYGTVTFKVLVHTWRQESS